MLVLNTQSTVGFLKKYASKTKSQNQLVLQFPVSEVNGYVLTKHGQQLGQIAAT